MSQRAGGQECFRAEEEGEEADRVGQRWGENGVFRNQGQGEFTERKKQNSGEKAQPSFLTGDQGHCRPEEQVGNYYISIIT